MAIAIAMLLPIGAALWIVLNGKRPNVREGGMLALAVATFLTVLSLVPTVMEGGRPELELFTMLPGLAIAFGVEPLGLLFALVASGLWIVTSTYAIGYMRAHHEGHQTRFFCFFSLAIAATLGAAFSRNVLTLLVFYELLTLSTYPLVTHHGDERARRGGRTYLSILLVTSIGLLLFAVIATWVLAGTLEFKQGGILTGHASGATLVALLALYAFGTGKAALMPFHRWLPAAMVAPTPVSALLHAVAVVKTGVFTILKVVVYVFGIDLLRDTGASIWLGWVAAGTILLASIVAMTKDNLKARLAYSTVSQLSYIVLGAAMANAWGLLGGGLHIATHAFGKITLFFCAGAIYVAAHKTEVSDMRGIGRTMPITTFAFMIGALSIIGLPPFGGTWSKWYLALGALDAGQIALVAVLMISSLLNIAYLMPIPIRGFLFAPEDGESGRREAPAMCLVPICLTAVGCAVLFIYGDRVIDLLAPIVAELPTVARR